MKRCASDIRLLLSLVGAHILIYLAFQNDDVFWYLYTAAMLFCMSFAIANNKNNYTIEQSLTNKIIYGVISGLVLYAIFFLGNLFIDWLHLSDLAKDVNKLYKILSPNTFWHYLVLFVIIIPGEEIFWRGYVQKKLSEHGLQSSLVIILSTILYTLPMLYSQNLALVVAGAAAGLMWAILYQRRNSVALVIVSHIIFNLMLLVILPL